MTFPGVDETDVAGAAVAQAAEAATSVGTPTADPAAPPAAAKYGLTAWGSKFMREEFDILCPSGQTCRARKLEVEDALALGILESLDIFSSTIMKDVNPDSKEQAKSDVAVSESLKDPEKRANFFGTVNRVVAHCVLKPTVSLYDDGELPEGTVFANDIPFTDKMHIFRQVFSERTATIEPFREGQEGSVAPVEAESGVPLPTE